MVFFRDGERKFFWGAATSAHQVEGGNNNDWTEWEIENAELLAKEASQRPWPEFILKNYPSPLMRENYLSGIACDHYKLFQKDFDMAKALGHNAHRFSVEWSRIEPEEGKFDKQELRHYRQVVAAMRERGLEPFVTLWHFTLPLWLKRKGGWEWRGCVEYFVRYVEQTVEALRKEASFWITLNEPEIYASNSFLRGKWPPQKSSFFSYISAFHNLIRAHRLAYMRIKELEPKLQIGIAKNNIYFEGWIAPLVGWWWNFYFLDRIRKYQDFIGLNYYFHNRIYGLRSNQNENRRLSDLGWEIYPRGIYVVLKGLKKYRKPIYVTENGLADARDAERERFIEEHIEWMLRAKREGADVRGYFYWSLLDNFEWDKGFWPRFGLLSVDYRTMQRSIRPSAIRYKEIIMKNLEAQDKSS
jgi:beta-glucosidase